MHAVPEPYINFTPITQLSGGILILVENTNKKWTISIQVKANGFPLENLDTP